MQIPNGLRCFAIICRIALLVHYAAMLAYALENVFPKIATATSTIKVFEKNLWGYLSLWTNVFQVAYTISALAEDFFTIFVKSAPGLEFLKRANSYFFVAVFFPFSIATASLFWTMYIFRPELLVPFELLNMVSVAFHVGLHLVIVIPAVTEILFVPGREVKQGTAVRFLNIAISSYIVSVCLVYIIHNVWVYTILEYLTWPGKLVFAAFFYILCLGCLVFGIKLQKFVSNRYKLKAT